MSLDTGGAEESLRKLTLATGDTFEHRVISFGRPSRLSAEMEGGGVAVRSLDLKRTGPLALWRAVVQVRRHPPDLMQGWMYYGNLIAAVLRRLGSWPVVWNVRHSPVDLDAEKLAIRAAIRLGRHCRPDLVIYNSHDGKAVHAALGYGKFPDLVIPNGVDVGAFRPDDAVRATLRRELRAGERKVLAMVGRFHRHKGVDRFLRVVGALARQGCPALAVLAGPGMDRDNPALARMLAETGLAGKVELLGDVADLAGFLPGVDVLVLASSQEGMPNVLMEAMACGVTAVATDVGDVARILTDPERLAEPDDELDLTRKVARALASATRRDDDRRFIAENYSLARTEQAYRDAYASLLS